MAVPIRREPVELRLFFREKRLSSGDRNASTVYFWSALRDVAATACAGSDAQRERKRSLSRGSRTD